MWRIIAAVFDWRTRHTRARRGTLIPFSLPPRSRGHQPPAPQPPLEPVPSGARFYGGAGTIHSTGVIDVETRGGVVSAVWFRCQQLPWRQVESDEDDIPSALLSSSEGSAALPSIYGLTLIDPEGSS